MSNYFCGTIEDQYLCKLGEHQFKKWYIVLQNTLDAIKKYSVTNIFLNTKMSLRVFHLLKHLRHLKTETGVDGNKKEHEPTNVGRISLERQARQFNSGAVA